MASVRELFLVVGLLIPMVAGHVAGNNTQTGPSEAPGELQRMIKAAWRSSGQTQGRESQEDITRKWLAPLDAVVVVPQVATADFGRYRFDEMLVKTTVESALRRKAPDIIDTTTRPDALTTATLCVLILGKIHSGGQVASVCILMKLQQEVALVAAERPTFAHADTWQRAVFLTGTPRSIRDQYPKELRDLASQFADDWAASH
ncbi:MAG: hypothetical protein JSW27_00520 [Phycisphaerales bacterium]|nr:MAG: hypothetical protein JSW27_00520 [Phycisphaerales bacterium]